MHYLSNDIPIIENLCNLEELSSTKSFTLIVNPLKLVGASGSPVRAIAVMSYDIVSLSILCLKREIICFSIVVVILPT